MHRLKYHETRNDVTSMYIILSSSLHRSLSNRNLLTYSNKIRDNCIPLCFNKTRIQQEDFLAATGRQLERTCLCVPTTPNSTCGLVTCHQHILVPLCSQSWASLTNPFLQPQKHSGFDLTALSTTSQREMPFIWICIYVFSLHLNNDDSTCQH